MSISALAWVSGGLSSREMRTTLSRIISASMRLFFVGFLMSSPVGAEETKSSKLSSLRAENEKKVSEASSSVDELNNLYFNQLEKLIGSAKEKGNLDLAVASLEEQKAFLDRGDNFPQPSKLPELAKLQKIYAAQYSKLVAERNVKLGAIRAAYHSRLDALIRELTKEGELDLAIDVKKELTNVDQLIKASAAKEKKGPVTGCYVRVELMKKEALSLAEVQVFSGGNNVARRGKATQSSTLGNPTNPTAEKAIDGNTDGEMGNGSTTHTNFEENPWWEVDLLKNREVSKVVIWNRLGGYQGRLDGFKISILDANRNTVWQTEIPKAPVESMAFEFVPAK